MDRILKIVGILFFALVLYTLIANVLLSVAYGPYVLKGKSDVEQSMDVGLVLGTSQWTTHGEENPYFTGRVEAASSLFDGQVVRHLILSGDNAEVSYNEPQALQRALSKRGVPKEDMTLDYAGFRTLDSVVRSKEVFGQDSLMIISQRFHLPRALFIARKNGIVAYGYAAEGPASAKVLFREVLARSLSVVDVYIFNRKPRFLGEKESITIRNK